MASIEKSFATPPAFVSNLKDVLKSRQAQGHIRAGDLCDAFTAERENSAAREPLRDEEFRNDVVHPQDEEFVKTEDERPIVLITNDDGIQAPGLRALVEALVDGGRCNVHVCAPESEKSGIGHSITLRDTIAVSSVEIKGATAYEVTGTPADCVSLSLSGVLFSWTKPALVLSGINKGSNCGYHIFYSGTVAGAREAFMCGVPSMSLSLNWKKGESCDKDFRAAAEVYLPLIHMALADIEKGIFPRGFFLNIDVPTKPTEHKGLKFTRQGSSWLARRWCAASLQRHISGASVGKGHGIGIQLAQLGRAASAAGAARRLNSPMKNLEIDSVAGPENGTHPSNTQKKYFQSEFFEHEVGEENEHDHAALEQGYVTVTPLGILTHLEPDTEIRVANWITSVEVGAVPSTL